MRFTYLAGYFYFNFYFFYILILYELYIWRCVTDQFKYYSFHSSSCPHNVTEQMPGDFKLACINKQRSLYNLHIHLWVIQYEQIHFHPSLFILYPKRTVDRFLCSWDVALKLLEGNLCILIEVTVLLLYEIATWINKPHFSWAVAVVIEIITQVCFEIWLRLSKRTRSPFCLFSSKLHDINSQLRVAIDLVFGQIPQWFTN